MPPPVIDSARVVSYAFVDDIPYRQHGRVFVGDKLLESVPRLAIVVNLGKHIGPMLFHCDERWNSLGTSGAGTVADVKDRAEQNYPGVSSRWVDVNTSVEEALQYYDQQTGSLSCNFCGKRPFETEGGWVEGRAAHICRNCIDMYL
jgi:hypothetical protein